MLGSHPRREARDVHTGPAPDLIQISAAAATTGFLLSVEFYDISDIIY
jgi:hypothetical protein